MAEFEFTHESFPEEIHIEKSIFFRQPHMQMTNINANCLYVGDRKQLHNGTNTIGILRLGYIDTTMNSSRVDAMYKILDVTTYPMPGRDSFIINPFRDFLDSYLMYDKVKLMIDGLPEIYYRQCMTFEDRRIVGMFFAGVVVLKQLRQPRGYVI